MPEIEKIATGDQLVKQIVKYVFGDIPYLAQKALRHAFSSLLLALLLWFCTIGARWLGADRFWRFEHFHLVQRRTAI